MNGYPEAVRYLLALLQERVRAAWGQDTQSGALSLEWIIIAVAIAAVAMVAVGIFVSIVTKDANSLPAGTPGG